MSGCFGSSPHDRWMERQLDDYLDSLEGDGSGDFDFNTKLRGGTVRVKGRTERHSERDYDGVSSWLEVEDLSITWTFHEDAEVWDLTDDEEEEIKGKVLEIAEDY